MSESNARFLWQQTYLSGWTHLKTWLVSPNWKDPLRIVEHWHTNGTLKTVGRCSIQSIVLLWSGDWTYLVTDVTLSAGQLASDRRTQNVGTIVSVTYLPFITDGQLAIYQAMYKIIFLDGVTSWVTR